MSEFVHLGTARVTPPNPIPLAGFAHRTGAFDDIHSPLFLRVLFFSHTSHSALLISADIFCWGTDLTAEVREALSSQLGIPPDTVILHATHNHSGPQTSRLFSPSLGIADDAYLDLLKNAASEAAELAKSTSEPVTIERGAGVCRIGINRRRREGGVIRMAPNPEGPMDPQVTVVRFRALNSVPKALLVHYACHPTTSGANQVCAEYPGLAMASLEADTPLVAAFLQGCCGDVRPALIRDGEFYRGDASAAAALAHDFASEVGRVLRSEMTSCGPSALAVRHEETSLPSQAVSWSPSLESVRLDLTQDLGLLTFNAEMVTAYGLYTKDVSQAKLLPIGYTNGMIGYVTTRLQIEEGGYESNEAFRYYGQPAPFEPSVEEVVMGHISLLAQPFVY